MSEIIKTSNGLTANIHNGNCLEVMAGLSAIDCIVTDPPYGISFMGKGWDHKVPGVEIWKAAYDALKPGGYLLAFAGTRTQHRMACAIEDAGFEIRDMIAWVYGSGFPKSHNVSKAIDKAAEATRNVVDTIKTNVGMQGRNYGGECVRGELEVTEPSTDSAKDWEGWGTALKPALEPITVARKPLEGTVAENVLKHGTGAINIDACRIGDEEITINTFDDGAKPFGDGAGHDYTSKKQTGRWPANFIHDGSDEVEQHFPESRGQQGDVLGTEPSQTGGEGTNCYGEYGRVARPSGIARGDTGSASRFFYVAKASKSERDKGLTKDTEQKRFQGNQKGGGSMPTRDGNIPTSRNIHPTVKPLDLMKYLCRMIAPAGATILDCFMGSGTTGVAALQEGCNFIGIEKEPEYYQIAKCRIEAETSQGELF